MTSQLMRIGKHHRPEQQASAYSERTQIARRQRIGIVISFLLFLSLAQCTRNTTAPVAKPSPAQVSSSDQVVKVSASSVSIPENGSAEAKVMLAISPGFHINANPATFSYLIATELQPGQLAGISIDKPAYPPAVKKKFQFAEEQLAVYEGDASIKLQLRTSSNAAKGNQSLPFKLRVQACDDEKCYPPATLDGSIPIDVK
jgi:uncharacterized protein